MPPKRLQEICPQGSYRQRAKGNNKYINPGNNHENPGEDKEFDPRKASLIR